MRKTDIFAVAVVLVLSTLMLTACGKQEFGATENTGRRMTITAEKADVGAFIMTGVLEVGDGEKIAITSDLTKGSVRVEIYDAPEEKSPDEMPVVDGEAIITANVAATDAVSGTVPAGDYLVKAICLEKATGIVQVEVKPAS